MSQLYHNRHYHHHHHYHHHYHHHHHHHHHHRHHHHIIIISNRRLVEKVQANPYARMSFDYVALWTDTESVFLALVIFLATMKFLRILKFNKHISIVTKSMAISKGPLLSYSVCFVVALLGFATFGNITFGSSAYMFSTFPRSIVNSFEMILGKGEKNLRFNTGRKIDLHQIYFWSLLATLPSTCT